MNSWDEWLTYLMPPRPPYVAPEIKYTQGVVVYHGPAPILILEDDDEES